MDDMQREALRRAEKMRSAFYSNSNVHTADTENNSEEVATSFNEEKEPEKRNVTSYQKENEHKREEPFKEHQSKKEKFNPQNSHKKERENNNDKSSKEGEGKIFDFLLKDKEATLILLMIFFLYDDNTDPMLLMALVYLLI